VGRWVGLPQAEESKCGQNEYFNQIVITIPGRPKNLGTPLIIFQRNVGDFFVRIMNDIRLT
jgi:hypothetical protein